MTGAKVKDGSLGVKDIGGSLPRGPRGVEGPRGDTGPAGADGAPLTRAAFSSRETGAVPVPLTPVGTAVDVLDLAVPAGSSGYVASSGNIVVSGPSRLVAVANATVHSDPAGASLICSLVLDGNRSMGPASNGQLNAGSHLSVAVTGGADVDPGTHNLRLRCSGEPRGSAFHRGSLTVVATRGDRVRSARAPTARPPAVARDGRRVHLADRRAGRHGLCGDHPAANSVGSRQIKPNAVTGAKVKDGSLALKDLGGSLPRGPRGAQGPPGQSGTGLGSASLGFASRDPVTAGPAVDVGATNVDLIALSVPAGTSGYVASSGPVTVSGPSRLVAAAEVVILDAAATRGNVACSIALVSTEVRAIGSYVNANIEPNSGYQPVAVSAGSDVEAGTYDVRVRCASAAPSMSFHRGNLTVVVTPR